MEEALTTSPSALFVSTECAHVFDSSTNRSLDDVGSDKVYLPTFFVVV